MPRTLAPELLACLDRENPRVEIGVELSAPDVARVLRRPDLLLTSPDPQVSLTPAASLVSSASGIALVATSVNIASFLAGGSSPADVNREDPTTRIKGVSWAVDPAFDAARLRSFTARLRRSSSIYHPTFELQIYRASGRWGVLTKADGTHRIFFYWEFAPLLSNPAVVRYAQQTWAANVADVVFDLTGQNIVIDGTKEALPSGQNNGWANYYFSIRQVGPVPNSIITWQADAVTSRTVAGVGVFDQTWWSRTRAGDAWAQQNFSQVPQCSIQIDDYSPSGGYAEAVYKIDLGRVPTAGTTGRIHFTRSTPLGTAVTAELSTTGSGGSYAAVLDGTDVSTVQQLYHLRVRLTPSSSHRLTPSLNSIGIEFDTVYDVGRVSALDPLQSDTKAPFLEFTIGDGRLTVVRDGRRDYRDDATVIGSTKPTTQLEVRYYLKSSHPKVTRDKWIRLGRATVADRIPSETSETFVLESYLSMLKRDIPLPQETINQVVTVQAAPAPTQLAVTVSPALTGTTGGGNEYDAKGYYVRVQSSTQPGVETGKIFPVNGNTGTTQLDFATDALSGTFAAGDTLAVHSGVLAAPKLEYKNLDPADIWLDIITGQIGIPLERVGMGHLPRGGLPPKVTDRAPGDATTQAKCKVSLTLDGAESADKLLDQLSFIMGGATTEIGGQICFVQIYPLRDVNGYVTVPLPAASRTIDPRDYSNASFPVGLASRLSAVTCSYGVDTTVAESMRFAPSQVEVADSDAINWLALSPNDNRGRTNIPDEIARWMYNTTDSGLFLSAELCHQVVAYSSTGMRVWGWNERNAHPENHAGDVIAVMQDRYTDYDPSGQVPIYGWKTFNVILLGVSADGRKFRGIVPGIQPTIVQSVGQGGGDRAGPSRIRDIRRLPMSSHGGVGSFQYQAGAPPVYIVTATVTAGPVNVTLNINPHELHIPNGDGTYKIVSYLGTGAVDITAFARAVPTYAYTDDPDFTSGFHTYFATQNPWELSHGSGRYYVGQVTVPAGAPPPTNGINASTAKL